MKTQVLKFSLPIIMGVALMSLTVFSLIGSLSSCTKEPSIKTCAAGSCMGSDGLCYGPCTGGSTCTTSPAGNCSAASAGGVYCCAGGGGGCTPTGCPSSAPWKCGGYCYTTPPSGNHACIKCP